MDKRLSRTEYLFTLMLIFMMIVAVASFFLGFKTGRDNTEQRYAHLLEKPVEVPKELQSYDQQQLVAFYHTIFLPFRQFQNKWFEHIGTLEAGPSSASPEDLFSELGRMADHTYEELAGKTAPVSSPLLQEAHADYLKSLKLFAEAARTMDTTRSDELSNRLKQDSSASKAIEYALSAQSKYYRSIVLWNQSIDIQLDGESLQDKEQLTLDEWKQLNVNLKNRFIAGLLLDKKVYEAFYPHDVTAKIDQMIENGRAAELKLTDLHALVDTLIKTGAVRPNDFLGLKEQFYQEAPLPQIPFFFAQN